MKWFQVTALVLVVGCGRAPLGRVTPTENRFISDTLYPVVGGAFRIDRRGWWQAPQDAQRNLTFRAGARFEPDTVVTLFGAASDHTVAHEAGHILDARRLAWEVGAAVDGRRHSAHRKHGYFDEPSEYIAEAFARAIGSARNGFVDSIAVDREFPGALEFVRWLKTRPPFTSTM